MCDASRTLMVTRDSCFDNYDLCKLSKIFETPFIGLKSEGNPDDLKKIQDKLQVNTDLEILDKCKCSEADYMKKLLFLKRPTDLDNDPTDVPSSSLFINRKLEQWAFNLTPSPDGLSDRSSGYGRMKFNKVKFSNYMDYAQADGSWGPEMVNDFLANRWVHSPQVFNSDACTETVTPVGVHWLSLYIRIDPIEKILDGDLELSKGGAGFISKILYEKELELIDHLKKEGITTFKDAKYHGESDVFSDGKNITIDDLLPLYRKFFPDKKISEIKGPLFKYYGSLEYDDSEGRHIMTRSTNRPALDLNIKNEMIVQSEMFANMAEVLLIPIDWNTKTQIDTFGCGYHALFFLYNRIFLDAKPVVKRDRLKFLKSIRNVMDPNPILYIIMGLEFILELDVSDEIYMPLYVELKRLITSDASLNDCDKLIEYLDVNPTDALKKILANMEVQKISDIFPKEDVMKGNGNKFIDRKKLIINS